MDHGIKAQALHDDKSLKLNCAQCTLMSLEDITGLDEDTARRIASGFGGGMRSGEACGALSGAVMALDLALSDGDGTKDGMIAPVIKTLSGKFREDWGALRCDELVALYGGKGRCPEFISYCARLAAAVTEDEKAKKE